ncbi:MAG: hypothetical protein K0Q67_1839 [Cellvibrio sp.]|nr:hypothetical protein [Cellvibrio sp.]
MPSLLPFSIPLCEVVCMNKLERIPVRGLSVLAIAISLVVGSTQASARGSSSSRLTLGDVTAGNGNISTSSNPASGAFDRQFLDSDTGVAGYWNFGAAIEYGNVDDLFDRIDEASAALDRQEAGSGDGDDVGGSGADVGTIDNVSNPDLEALIDSVKDRAVKVAAVLAFIRTEGYAIAQGGSEFALLINNDVLGGTLRFDVTGWINTSAVGLTEALEFDADAALAELRAAYDLAPGDPRTTFDLTGGLHLTFDPNTREVSATYDNDSLLLTRAAKLVEFGTSYSRPMFSADEGTLFFGVRPKLTQIGLTRLTTRLGDLTDAEDVFDDARDADFVTENKLGLDLGLLWQSARYRAGITLINLGEPEFDFPELDYSGISNSEIRKELGDTERYTAEHQFKAEGAWVSEGQRWSIFAAYDINSVFDPAGSETQWGSLSTSYDFENAWFNNIRAGVSRNFAGSELSGASLGATMFKFLNLDISSTLSETRIDGEELPRGLGAAIGFNYSF